LLTLDRLTIKIRSTESSVHPIIKKLSSEIILGDIQGFVFQATDEQLFDATLNSESSIKIFCLEAVEVDDISELIPKSIFSTNEWFNKLHIANFFNSNLLLLSHIKNDDFLFRLYKVENNNSIISFTEISKYSTESEFMLWWNSIKLLNQTKPTYEARSRQNLTIFDNVLEKNGSAWGGNIDGLVISQSNNMVTAIIELRQTRSFPLENYDPARFFLGTQRKSGDFKTWLPLIYLKNAYNLPLVLITVSTLDTSKFGFAKVDKIDKKALYYKDNLSPNRNLNNDIDVLKKIFDL
jgi:hypothetical protein